MQNALSSWWGIFIITFIDLIMERTINRLEDISSLVFAKRLIPMNGMKISFHYR